MIHHDHHADLCSRLKPKVSENNNMRSPVGVIVFISLMLVHPNRLPISIVHRLMDENDRFSDVNTLAAIDTQLEEFLDF